ncbi:hypothetical protein O3M35_001967 [Rhynocoris fuscipes]|uniref:valine--tRNA ligase n=1 Tax=Rhynocoris fuscipes TaxID=488301 RepID=A0AAW1CWW7_9HEMI
MYKRIFAYESIYYTVHRGYSSQLSAAYDPDLESKVRKRWEIIHDENEKRTFSMVLPPPNITGNLHLGHALTITIQDVIARWKQMNSNNVCWVPGFDHAGIATQAIVERTLYAKEGLTRHEIGREKFLKALWDWKYEKEGRTTEQIHSLGSILDWKRKIFTLDQEQKESVTYALKRLWDSGLIYRDTSLVNWCPHLGSVLSDIEVISTNISGPTAINLPGHDQPVIFGRLIKFAYPVRGKQYEIEVATTRPETILGDVAVAVHPSDQRYSHLQGAKLEHPFTGELIPLILDNNVDPNFGTGALKITPAHDQLDYEIGKRHNLPIRQVIDENGNLNSLCGIYSGLNRWSARENVINDLAKRNLLRSIEAHSMQIPICSRSGDVIELIQKDQWFVKTNEMAEKAAASVRKGNLILEPEKYNDIWFSWLENIKDWCISRQVWWGHEIPFYHCSFGENHQWIFAENKEEALIKAKKLFKSDNISIVKDNDVLDTWFSSGLLPFTAHGWPKKSPDLNKYYPLSLMVTGNDILFFWVARMVMLGLQLTDQLPFKKVLLHGIICDNFGRKMSKSRGNVIDPMDVIKGCTIEDLKNQVISNHKNGIIDVNEVETAISGICEMFPNGIPKCGADALRFTLMSQRIKNPYINFNVKECHSNKLFCNKLWQATKFALFWSEKLQIKPERKHTSNFAKGNLLDKWIINRLSLTVDTVNKAFDINEFHLATAVLKQFLYSELCCVYIEYIKSILKSNNVNDANHCCKTLLFCLEVSFRCLAPFMPHLTDELYSKLPTRKSDSVMKCLMPSDLKLQDIDLDVKVTEMLKVIEIIRRIKTENGISSLKPVKAYIVTDKFETYLEFKHPIEILSRCSEVNICEDSRSFLNLDNRTFIEEIIDNNTRIYINLEEETSIPIKSTPNKLKLKKELDKLLKMRSNKGYENVLPEVRKAHDVKILKIKTKLKVFDELEEKWRSNN